MNPGQPPTRGEDIAPLRIFLNLRSGLAIVNDIPIKYKPSSNRDQPSALLTHYWVSFSCFLQITPYLEVDFVYSNDAKILPMFKHPSITVGFSHTYTTKLCSPKNICSFTCTNLQNEPTTDWKDTNVLLLIIIPIIRHYQSLTN